MRPTWQRILIGIGYSLLIIGCLAIGTIGGWLQSGPTGELVSTMVKQTPPEEAFARNDLTVLLLGEDDPLWSQDGEADHRSDTMMLLRLDFDGGKIGGFSIPRDMLASAPGYRARKINAFHAAGGEELAQAAVEHEFGLEIDRVISLNYDSFIELIDLVGGVPINVDKRMIYEDKVGGLSINLQPGEQVLSGYEAMGYARYRRDPTGDFKRTERQRNLLVALKDRIVSKPSSWSAVAEKVLQILNHKLTAEELGSLLVFAQSLTPSDVSLGGLTGQAESRKDLGSVVLISESAKEEALEKHGLSTRPAADLHRRTRDE